MATYLILNLAFLIVTMFVLHLKPNVPSRLRLVVLLIVLILTALFDSLMIGLQFFSYNQDKVLGIYIGNAPIEDFFYAILAVVVVPTLWNRFKDKEGKANV